MVCLLSSINLYLLALYLAFEDLDFLILVVDPLVGLLLLYSEISLYFFQELLFSNALILLDFQFVQQVFSFRR